MSEDAFQRHTTSVTARFVRIGGLIAPQRGGSAAYDAIAGFPTDTRGATPGGCGRSRRGWGSPHRRRRSGTRVDADPSLIVEDQAGGAESAGDITR
jgi:hypothetical protein